MDLKNQKIRKTNLPKRSNPYNNKKFIQFLFDNKIILIGDFVTKSKRQTPFFLNFGKFYTGESLAQLGKYYAQFIHQKSQAIKKKPRVIFGPSYKGIPLSISTTIALNKQLSDISYSFNRKEIKDHGDGGILVGNSIEKGEKVVIIDDVITSGISLLESINLLKKRAAQILFILVGVDRMEKSIVQKENSTIYAKDYIEKETGIPVYSLANIQEILNHALSKKYVTNKDYQRCMDYLKL